MKAKKNKRERSEQMQQVSAGLRDVLGMTQWRKEHPHATWAEIEAAVDEQINQLRAQLLEDLVQPGEGEDWSQKPPEERPTRSEEHTSELQSHSDLVCRLLL